VTGQRPCAFAVAMGERGESGERGDKGEGEGSNAADDDDDAATLASGVTAFEADA